jgi:hypothetical protein
MYLVKFYCTFLLVHRVPVLSRPITPTTTFGKSPKPHSFLLPVAMHNDAEISSSLLYSRSGRMRKARMSASSLSISQHAS